MSTEKDLMDAIPTIDEKMNERRNMEEPKVPHIHQALQAVNDDLKSIGKDQKGYNYNFRGIDDVLNVVGPLFKKHKILVRRVNAEITSIPNEKMNHFVLKATYMFVSTVDGSEMFSVGFGEGMDKGDKAIGCATSNAYKYVIFEMFNIPTEEQIDSDQKTAKENKVEPPKKGAPKKAEDAPKKSGGASFRKKKAEPKKDAGEL